MAFFLSPIGNSPQITATGAPLNAGTITTFQAGTATPVATYTDNAGSNPSVSLTLNTLGLPSSPVWLLGGQAVKFIIKDSLGNLIRTIDNVSGIDDAPAFVDGVRALVGSLNATTPLTKYDLQARAVTLRSSVNATVTQFNTATITCDLGLAGPAANGRDQAGAFAINSWIYLYFIWNGATLATLASTIDPATFTGSTLPTGYTHWAFATALRWNASSNLIPARTRGKTVWYQLDYGGVQRVLAAGAATVFTAINLASIIPPNALLVELLNTLSGTNASAGAGFLVFLRPTGSGLATGINAADTVTYLAGGSFEVTGRCQIPPGTTSQVDYRMSAAPTTGGATIEVAGYTIPNGDS